MTEAIIVERSAVGRAAWLAAPIAALMFAPVVIGFAAGRTDGYSHGTKAISELGTIGAPSAVAFNLLGFIVPGLFLAWFGFSLARIADNRVGPILLVGSGLMLAVSGIFALEPDVEGSTSTTLHYVGAMSSGLLWAPALFWVGPLLSRQFGLTAWGRLTPRFLLFLVVHIGWQVTFGLTGSVNPGWGQRIGFFGYFLWFAITGGLLWRQSGQRVETRKTA